MEPKGTLLHLQVPDICPYPLARSINSNPLPPTPHPVGPLSSLLRLGLPSRLFPSCFPTKTQYTPLLSLIRATCPAYLILLILITHVIFREEYRSLSSSLCNFLCSPVTSSLVGSNMPLRTLLSNTLSSLIVNDHVSHPRKTTGKIIVLYVLVFIFWIGN